MTTSDPTPRPSAALARLWRLEIAVDEVRRRHDARDRDIERLLTARALPIWLVQSAAAGGAETTRRLEAIRHELRAIRHHLSCTLGSDDLPEVAP